MLSCLAAIQHVNHNHTIIRRPAPSQGTFQPKSGSSVHQRYTSGCLSDVSKAFQGWHPVTAQWRSLLNWFWAPPSFSSPSYRGSPPPILTTTRVGGCVHSGGLRLATWAYNFQAQQVHYWRSLRLMMVDKSAQTTCYCAVWRSAT